MNYYFLPIGLDICSPVSLGRVPPELGKVLSPVTDVRLPRLAGWIERILGHEGIDHLQVRRVAVFVAGSNQKLVRLALLF